LESLLAGTGVDLAALQRRATGEVRVDAVDGWTLTLTQRLDTRSISAPNVVGIVDGSDPVLRDEYVVFSAHMDHLGIGGPDESGDSIFNGADDDASGTVAVMEVAQAVASLPIAPRRSMIFLLVSGEERGLWGSEYYADNPSVPVDRIAAGLNADMVGRNWPDTIVAIGKEHSDLGATLERVNGAHPEIGMTAIDDLWPEERFYFRSDHYNFARKGVPILFFFNGTHDDYHGLDDEPGRIDAEKAARITRLLFHLGVDVANADARPRWHPESYERIVTDRGGAGSR
jgi:Zn-dependent M28 family amino/carboxypeptidase